MPDDVRAPRRSLVSRAAWLGIVLALGLPPAPARAGGWCLRGALERTNRQIRGTVLDFTHNHGADHRIWSAALGEPRDLYVYLPPGYDSRQCYPLVLWLHGFAQDEQSFLLEVVKPIDEAMAAGRLPPAIVAAPDGSLTGSPCLFTAGSFFLNSKAGRFEDFVMQDVWGFLMTHFPIRPEREAHVLAGASMGGGGAYNLAIKYRDRVGVVLGVFPPLNTRWLDCHCRYFGNFDPGCWGWRTDFTNGHAVVGRFYGVVTIRMRRVVGPLYGLTPEAVYEVSRENPIEMLDRLDVRPGELAMYAGYGGRDQFNIDAQVESFLYRARQRGLCVAVGYDPNGRHDLATALRLMPGAFAWLNEQLAPYSPGR
jgi:S-formylglutathione hydrolase FrmB